jgi:hypothetical protein
MDENLNGTGVPRCACPLTVRNVVGMPTINSIGALAKFLQHELKRAAAPPLIQATDTATSGSHSAGYFDTTRLFVTENTFGTPLARRPARFLSVSLSATPSSVTFPFFTMMWMEGTAESA